MTTGTQILHFAITTIPLKSDLTSLRLYLKTSGIYALVNTVNGKCYIGSSISLSTRLLDYYQPAYIASQPKRHINRAILKYGIESFIIIILEYIDIDNLHLSEQAWIDDFKPEYNVLTHVSSLGGYKLTQAHKDHISKVMTGKKQSAERRAAQSVRQTGAGNPLWGRKHSAESKALMSLHAHKTFDKPGYAVEVENLLTGIRTSYISMNDAARNLCVSRTTIKDYAYNNKRLHDRYLITVVKP